MKTLLVTGATDGIGRQTALQLLREGHRVILHGRSAARLLEVADELSALSGQEVATIRADFRRLDEVLALASHVEMQWGGLDVLINNAGVFMQQREITPDGFETTFQVNHLAPFLLTQRLLPLLKASPDGRIVTVASVAHQRGRLDFQNLQGERRFDGYEAYALSKLGNVLHTLELAERLGPHPTVNCLHPGVIGTKLLRDGFRMEGGSVEQGARTSLFLALSDTVADVTGAYFDDGRPREPHSLARDAALRRRFWDTTTSLLARWL